MNKPKLIYSMIMSLDGYTEDEQGKFGWGVESDFFRKVRGWTLH